MISFLFTNIFIHIQQLIYPRVPRAPQQTRKLASESVWASLMKERRGPEDLRAAPKQGKRPKQDSQESKEGERRVTKNENENKRRNLCWETMFESTSLSAKGRHKYSM